MSERTFFRGWVDLRFAKTAKHFHFGSVFRADICRWGAGGWGVKNLKNRNVRRTLIVNGPRHLTRVAERNGPDVEALKGVDDDALSDLLNMVTSDTKVYTGYVQSKRPSISCAK